MSDVFISYSRRDSEFMSQLHARLTGDGHDVWVDWEDIPPTADWWQEIQSAIEEANIFAFIISPNSVISEICRDEIQYAIDNNKRFIPVLYQEIEDVNAPHVHPAIRSHNWISFASDQDQAYQKLVESFTTNPDYLRRHTRLLVRAKEWQTSGRQTGYLLEGAELTEFQNWLAGSQNLTPKPTELQYDYILSSQTQRTRVQLRIAGGLIFGVIIVSILAGVAFFQQQRIESQQVEQAFIEATALAQGTQIAAQQTNIAEVRVNATTIIQQANVENTQSALQGLIGFLQGTIEAFETRSAATSTPSATMTASPTITPTATITSTLPPTWTPTVEIDATSSDGEDNQASAQSVSTATVDPAIALTGTAQNNLYTTATAEAQITPSPTATATETTIPSPTATATLDIPAPVTPSIQTVTYVVQEGDFAVDIAARFNISVRDIMEANGISNPSLIFVGQRLVIPYQLGVETDETLLVAPSGRDTDDCGQETMPCATVRGAMAVAEGFAQIRLASGVYTEQLVLNEDVALVGNGVENTILTGDFAGTIITVNPDVSVTILGMTITGGSAEWGGAIANYGEVNVQSVKITGNVAELAGGGVANFGSFLGSFVEFADNYAPYFADIYSAPTAGFLADEGMDFVEETRLPDPRPDTDGPINIGALVQVTTTEGDRLNMRPEPTINSGPPNPLTRGTPLLVIGGPRRANNFRWWRVQTSIGTTGWVVDFDDEATILPVSQPPQR